MTPAMFFWLLGLLKLIPNKFFKGKQQTWTGKGGSLTSKEEIIVKVLKMLSIVKRTNNKMILSQGQKV
jgi:hypothetical protein